MDVAVPVHEIRAERLGALLRSNRRVPFSSGLEHVSGLQLRGREAEVVTRTHTNCREWDLVTPRRPRAAAPPPSDFIDDPRSAWRIKLIPVDPLLEAAFTNQLGNLARLADSPLKSATIQPTTWRLKISRITYR